MTALDRALPLARSARLTDAHTAVLLMCVFGGGWALVEEGNYAEGYTRITIGQEIWRDAGGVLFVPRDNMIRASGLIGLKRFDEAKGLLDEAIQTIEQTGHRMDEAEVHRVRGDLQRQEDAKLAEASYLKALGVARYQDARGLELRAAVSLARLWQGQGKREAGRELLAPIYNWFTEGLQTRDLRNAKALLIELS